MLDAASEDVLVHILAFCDVHAVVATLRSCTSLRRRLGGGTPRAAVAALWRRLHLRRWPASSLFQLNKRQLRLAASAAESTVAPCQCYYCIFGGGPALRAAADSLVSNHANEYSWERYRRRRLARRRDLTIRDGVYTLQGNSVDAHNGNSTPATARLHVTASTNLSFAGTVTIGRGTIHNNPANGSWKGHFGADAGGTPRSVYCHVSRRERSEGSTSRWKLYFEERLPTNNGWFEYEGSVETETGVHITGTFKWSMLAGRDRGTFAMTVVEREELCT